VDFALTEAAQAVVRILQQFPYISIPVGEKVELIGTEKQTMTIIISSSNGCRVQTRTTAL
jgi:hypothetical protein